MSSKTAGISGPIKPSHVVRHWQSFVFSLSKEIGCLATDTDVMSCVRTLKKQNASLVKIFEELEGILSAADESNTSYLELIDSIRQWKQNVGRVSRLLEGKC